MQICDVFQKLGEETFHQLLRGISIGKLKTYQLFDRMKARLHVNKLNSESLRKVAPRAWERIAQPDEEFASEIAQAILVSHLDMIKAVLDHLEVPHEEGFFAKDADVQSYLKDGWQQRVWNQFHATYQPAALLFYINHLALEVAKAEDVFRPAAA
jgi:hypothetical protein